MADLLPETCDPGGTAPRGSPGAGIPDWKRVRLPAALNFGMSIVAGFSWFYLVVYFGTQLRYSGGEIGLLYGVLNATALVGAFPMGVGSDRISQRHLVAAGFLFTAASCAGMAFTRAFWPMLFFFLFFGLGQNLFRISLDSYLFKAHDRERPGRDFGFYQGLRMAGASVSLVAWGQGLEKLSFPAALVIMGGACALLAFAALPLPRVALASEFRLAHYAREFLKPEPLFLAAWLFFFTLHWGVEQTCYGLFLRKTLGLSLHGMGYYMGAEFAILAALFVVLGRIHHRIRRLGLLMGLGLLLSGAGNIFMVTPNVYASFAWRAVHGVGDGIVMLLMYLGIARLFHVERVGGLSSLIAIVTMIGSTAGAMLFGGMGERLGYGVPLRITGIVNLLLILAQVAWLLKGRGPAARGVEVPVGTDRGK